MECKDIKDKSACIVCMINVYHYVATYILHDDIGFFLLFTTCASVPSIVHQAYKMLNKYQSQGLRIIGFSIYIVIYYTLYILNSIQHYI